MNDDSLLTLDAGHVTREPHADCHQTLGRLVCVIFSEATHYTGSCLLQSEPGCGQADQ